MGTACPILNPILFTVMPKPGATYQEWYNYNNLMYKFLKIHGISAAEKSKARENLLIANEPMFIHKAMKLKVGMYTAADFEDALQIERLQFLEVIQKCIEDGEPQFPNKAKAFGYGCEKTLYESYAPAGVNMPYTTKKRRVAKDEYKMTSVDIEQTTLEPNVSESKNFIKDLDQEQLHEGLLEAFEELTDLEKDCIILYELKGLSHREIAETIGFKSEGSSRYHYNNGIRKMKKKAKKIGLDNYLEDIFQ